jgi:hypothetical protein
MFSNFGLNGGGIAGMGFGRAAVSNTAPLYQYIGAAASAQSVGVAQYGSIWASSNCPSCDTAIREMQRMANHLGAQLAVPVNIAIDGKVGAGTVAALKQVLTVAASRGNPLAATVIGYSTPEMVAKHADTILVALKQISGALPATAPTTIPSLPAGGGSQIPTATGVQPGVISPGYAPAPSFFQANKKVLLISGAILAVGAAAAIVILKTPAASAG